MNEIVSAKSKMEIWRERIAIQAKGKQSVRLFCLEQQITPQAFYYWKDKISGIKHAPRQRRFIHIANAEHPRGVAPRIHLPNGVKIELGESLESEHVIRLIRSLCGVGQDSRGGEVKGGRHAKP